MVKSIGKWWVGSDDPIVEVLQQEVDDLCEDLDEREKEIADMQLVINTQQKLIDNLKEKVNCDIELFGKHLNLAREMVELVRALAKVVEKQLGQSKAKEISLVIDQPTEGTSTDQTTDVSSLLKAEPVDEVESSST